MWNYEQSCAPCALQSITSNSMRKQRAFIHDFQSIKDGPEQKQQWPFRVMASMIERSNNRLFIGDWIKRKFMTEMDLWAATSPQNDR